MTEPNEPKIVHFQPRAQAPVQDTAGNWEPNEQLFGLEELLQQLPPIRKLHLEKGRLTDLVRLYPDMKRTFDAPELLPEAVIASAMVRRRMELLLFRADDRREAGARDGLLAVWLRARARAYDLSVSARAAARPRGHGTHCALLRR